jgi:transcriptional regulator with XRE-family HTH domain
MEAKDSVDVLVRRRLRELRMQRGLTLEDVAQAARIDVSTLSRLESGKRRLALDHLPRLAAALSVSTDELVREPVAEDPRVHTFKIRVSSRRRKPPTELPVHEGQEWIYVLSGRLRLVLGERDFTINPGEAVEFSTWTPHWFGVVDGPLEAIMMFGPHGERLHLHS